MQIFFQMLTPEQISNLPTDARKDYLKTALMLEERKKQEVGSIIT